MDSPPLAATAEVTAAAHRLLAQKHLPWGRPVQVRWQKPYRRFLVTYATPERERLMGGTRGIFVEPNGLAWLKPQL